MRSASWMKLLNLSWPRSPWLGVAFVVLTSSGCSIYKNRGRDQFEARATGNVKTEVGTSATYTPENETGLTVDEDFSSCWIQRQDEPLWATPKGSVLQIRSINDKKMAVCLETEQHD